MLMLIDADADADADAVKAFVSPYKVQTEAKFVDLQD